MIALEIPYSALRLVFIGEGHLHQNFKTLNIASVLVRKRLHDLDDGTSEKEVSERPHAGHNSQLGVYK